MRIPRKGEKGFTLIELLIVVAILGVLAAVVIPNVSRFMGAGEEEAAETELANIQTAVISMMVDNGLSELAVPVDGVAPNVATNDMNAFPDKTPALDKTLYGDEAYSQVGYVLYDNEMAYDDLPAGAPDGTVDTIHLVKYVAVQLTKGTYTVDAMGTVKQETTGYE